MEQITSIPTFIINLEKRTDRKGYAMRQFEGRPEFDVQFFSAIQDTIPAFGLYKSLHSIVTCAQRQELPFVLICEDDHKFTHNYNTTLFRSYIDCLEKYDADIFLGGVSWFDCAIRVEENLYWIDNFTGAQFLLVRSCFYQRILTAPFTQLDIIDRWISSLSDNIFVSVPMISLQQDFGYSDVTAKNDGQGRVDRLFLDIIERWKTLQDVMKHIQKFVDSYSFPGYQEDVQLPTYIVNINDDKQIVDHIKGQFLDKSEFDLSFINITKEANGEADLWKGIHDIIEIAEDNEEDVILICANEHEFINSYSKEILFEAIYQGAYLGADIVLGGISEAQQILPVSKDLCWVNRFRGAQFIIVYNKFFKHILEATWNDLESIDVKLSGLTPNKYVIHPFVSIKKRNDYSNIFIEALQPKEYLHSYEACDETFRKIKKISNRFKFLI